MDAVEKAYAIETEGSYHMPQRIHLEHNNNTLLYMPCFIEGIFGTKMLTLFPENQKKGLPVINGLVVLNEVDSGIPVALLDGGKLTALRTGAVGGVAVRRCAPEKAARAGLIGAGIQGFHQLLFATAARKIREISVFDKDGAKLDRFCRDLTEALPAVKVKAAKNVEELLQESEIVITATPSCEPVLPDDKELLENRCYIGIGSYKPEMREFPGALFSLVNSVLVDTEHGLTESGDLISPLREKWIRADQILPFSRYLHEEIPAAALGNTRLFKSVGMALFDIVVGDLLYRKALERGIGIELN